MSIAFSIRLNILSLPLVVIFFFLAHLFKFTRVWLVLMEEKKLSLFEVFFLYARTTLVNLIIPFKLGEIYRIAVVKKVTGAIKTGVLLVLVDRFFDTMALLILTLPFMIFFGNGADPVILALSGGLLAVLAFYLFYAPSYRYLNKYLIMTKRSGRALFTLEALDRANEWYIFLQKLIRGRSPLILLSSLLGWIMEFAALKALAGVFDSSFGINAFITYINSILSGEKSRIGFIYNAMGIAVFAVLTVVLLILTETKREREDAGHEKITGHI